MKHFLRTLPPAGYIVLLTVVLSVILVFPAVASAATVTVNPANTAPPDIFQGRQDDFISFDLTTGAGTAQWTGISVDLTGTAGGADISAVKIYKSVNTNWSPTDLAISQNTTFTGGVANIILSEQQTISTVITWHYFVVYSISGSAGIGKTVGAKLASSTSFTITGPDTMNNFNLPFTSGKATIKEAPDIVRVRGFNDALISTPKPPAGATRLVSMLQLQPRTESKTATWTAVRVSRTGNSSNAWINSVRIYSATNTAEFDPNYNTLIGTGTIDSTLTLAASQVITTGSTVYYFIVFELNDQATLGSTIGARIANEGRFAVAAPDGVRSFQNLDSKLSTFVGDPHGSPGNTGAYVNTNYCSACHNIHMARQNRRILNKLYTSDPLVVNNNTANVYNALCFSCHDGTGSSKNIKSDYDAAASPKQKGAGDDSGPVISPGHMTDQTGTVSGGYLSSTKYNAGVKLPCMICHDVHQSRRNNYAMIADGLYNYASSATETTTNPAASYYWDSSSTVWGSSGVDNYTRRKRCEVCHRNADGTSDTTSSSGTGSWIDGKSVVVGIDLGRPGSHATGNKSTSWCGSCHGVHKIRIEKIGAGAESIGNIACDECHQVSIYDPMRETSTYHHYIQNAGVSNLPSSGTKYPTKNTFSSTETTSTERRCLMCHADHDVFSPATGGIPANGDRAKNLRASIAVVPTAGDTSSFSDTDFNANQNEGGICVSCHAVSQTKNTTNQKFLAAQDNTQTLVIDKVEFAEATTAHNYEATSTFPGRAWDNAANRPFEFRANCLKCHNTMDSVNSPYNAESDAGSKQDSTFKFQLHATEVRRLLAWLNILPQDSTRDPLEENFCNRCHSTTDNPNSGGGRDYYNRASMSAQALDIKNQFAKARVHPVGGSLAKHRAVEGESANWNPASNRHVECEDCHNVHAAKKGNHTKGSAAVGGPNLGVWGVAPSGFSVENSGTAGFIDNGTAVTGTGTLWLTSMSGSSWYIKHNWDMRGRWYKVQSVNSNTSLTLARPFDGSLFPTRLAVDAQTGYTALKMTYSRVNKVTDQYQLCLKCHSLYAYDDSPPRTPSRHAGGTTEVTETDIGFDFSPDNYAYHPIMKRGANQPITATGQAATTTVSWWNSYWPKWTSGTVSINTSGAATFSNTMPGTVISGWYLYDGTTTPPTTTTANWYQLTGISSGRAATVTPAPTGAVNNAGFTLSAGLGNAFVPPWGPWSRTVCTDCHGSEKTNDAEGPHGSSRKWILKSTTQTITFQFWDSDNTTKTVTPGTAAGLPAWNATYSEGEFCFNCHRRDVYGDVGQGGALADNGGTTVNEYRLGRVAHDVTGHPSTYDAAEMNSWGIVCMNCHGGDSLGGIHGTMAKESRDADMATVAVTGYRGRRFLNGATWTGVERATTATRVQCWTKRDSDEVNVCRQGHPGDQAPSGQNGFANYNY